MRGPAVRGPAVRGHADRSGLAWSRLGAWSGPSAPWRWPRRCCARPTRGRPGRARAGRASSPASWTTRTARSSPSRWPTRHSAAAGPSASPTSSRYLLERYGAPRYMDWWERAALMLGGVMGHYLPSVVVPPIVGRLRQETESLILPGEDEDSRRYLAERRARRHPPQPEPARRGDPRRGGGRAPARGLPRAARPRRRRVHLGQDLLGLLARSTWSPSRTRSELVKARLRALYRQALRHHYRQPDGRVTPKFVNLDMEEYRDLHLTVEAFQRVLDEPEFLPLKRRHRAAGLPARLARVQRALDRPGRSRASARRRADQAPHRQGRQPGHGAGRGRAARLAAGAVPDEGRGRRQLQAHARVRLPPRARPRPCSSASPATTCSTSPTPWCCARSAASRPGSSSRCSRAWPTTRRARSRRAPAACCSTRRWCSAEDFHSAIAYLVRRLDENTAPENFLRHVFGLEPGSPTGTRERERFLAAFELADGCRDAPRRTQDRGAEAAAPVAARLVGALRERARHRLGAARPTAPGSSEVVADWRERPAETVPLQIGGELVAGAVEVDGRDPLAPRAHRLSLRAGRRRAGRAARSTPPAPRRPSVGRPAGGGAPAPARAARPRCSRGGAAI